jgi:DNA-binding NarL/FixJ family response regulator
MLRIVIADPDELLSLRMSGQVSRAHGLEVIGTARDCSSALEMVRRTQPDIVLVDLFMPPLGGVALIAAIKYAMPATRVVVLVSEAREATLRAAYAAGALGYVTKDGSFQHVPAPLGWCTPDQRGDSGPPAQGLTPAASRAGKRFTTAGV